MLNLYSAERTNFVNHESPLIDETIFKMSKNLFQIQDTARFQNNWQENSITITRGVKDTTVEMGGIVNQSYVYGRLFYDLRDSSWCLDSLVHYYKKSDLPFPIFFIRKDANGKIIDRYMCEEETDFLYDFGLSRHRDRQNSDPSFSLLFICMCPLYCRTILRT